MKRLCAAVLAVLAAQQIGASATSEAGRAAHAHARAGPPPPRPAPRIEPFELSDVALGDETMQAQAAALNTAYLMDVLDPDRLLWTFRRNAGLPTQGALPFEVRPTLQGSTWLCLGSLGRMVPPRRAPVEQRFSHLTARGPARGALAPPVRTGHVGGPRLRGPRALHGPLPDGAVAPPPGHRRVCRRLVMSWALAVAWRACHRAAPMPRRLSRVEVDSVNDIFVVCMFFVCFSHMCGWAQPALTLLHQATGACAAVS